MDLSDDEIQTIKDLISDWGWDYALSADRAKVVALARKLGLAKWADDNEIK